MPEYTDLPPVLQTFGEDLAVAMNTADAAASRGRGAGLVRTIGGLPRRAPKRCAAIAVAVAAVVALVVLPSLDGSRTGIAQAAVLTRAAAALDQPNTILYLQVQDYSADGRGIVMLGGNELGGFAMCVPGPCVRSGAPTSAQTGISADPAGDTLTYSSQEWLSPDGSRDRTLYDNGDEVVNNKQADELGTYDAADNTVTTLTDMGYATTPSPPSPQPPSPFPSIANFADPAYYETLYRQAQAGEQSTVGATTIHTQLVGQTTIAGKSVYELAFTFHFTPPSNPPPGDMCGSTVCSPADRELLLYLDSQTFTPVRTVYTIVNTNDNPGIPPGSAVWIVTDYSVQSLPDTPANEALLQMAPHPGATQVQSTYAQYRAEHGLNPATGSTTTTGASGATGSTGQAGTTGSTGTSASGATGAGGTTAAN